MESLENRNVYVGHRYVPKIFGEWNNTIDYEGLSIVTYQGTSYTSKKRVPVGIDILNNEYWVVTGNYNAQVETYRQEVKDLETTVNDKVNQEQVTMIHDELDHQSTEINNISINLGSLGAKDETEDPLFNNREVFDNAFSMLQDGGTIILPKGKVFKISMLKPPSNITIDLNGSTLKLIDNAQEWHQMTEFRSKNVVFKNGKLDGNKQNQTQSGQRGIYLLDVDGVTIENIEAFNFTGEGLYIGYIGFQARNVILHKIKTHNNNRNDIVISNVENLYGDVIDIKSIANISAPIDIETHDDTDIIRNVHLNNVTVDSMYQPSKIITNGTASIIENISFNHITFKNQALSVESGKDVTLNDVRLIDGATVEFKGTQKITINNFMVDSSRGYGLYIYESSLTGVLPSDVTLNNVQSTNSRTSGIVLQNIRNLTLNNVRSYNNGDVGILMINNVGMQLLNVISKDLRTEGKSQKYGIEFRSNNRNISMLNVDCSGNSEADFLNIPTKTHLLKQDELRFVSADGVYAQKMKFENDTTLVWDSLFRSRRLELSHTYNNATTAIPNGTIYEDSSDGLLKYKNLSGVTQTLSNVTI